MKHKYILLIAMQTAICLLLAATSVYGGDTIPITSDPTLQWMQAAGFPTWAAVVGWGVVKVTNEIKAIHDKMSDFANRIEHRINRLDLKIERVHKGDNL